MVDLTVDEDGKKHRPLSMNSLNVGLKERLHIVSTKVFFFDIKVVFEINCFCLVLIDGTVLRNIT